MQTRTFASCRNVLLLALLTLGARHAQAITITGPPVGIALGQSARVSLGVLPHPIRDYALSFRIGFYDDDGALLAESRGLVKPGKTISFDFNRDEVIRERNRIEIHAVVDIPASHIREVAIRLELFDNGDGKPLGVQLILNDFRGNITTNAGLPAFITAPFGIARGQTVRVNVHNPQNVDQSIETRVRFFDEEGDLLAEVHDTVNPGKTVSFDLSSDDVIRERQRVQIRAIIEMLKRPHEDVVFSLEVFDHDDGRTTVYDYDILRAHARTGLQD